MLMLSIAQISAGIALISGIGKKWQTSHTSNADYILLTFIVLIIDQPDSCNACFLAES